MSYYTPSPRETSQLFSDEAPSAPPPSAAVAAIRPAVRHKAARLTAGGADGGAGASALKGVSFVGGIALGAEKLEEDTRKKRQEFLDSRWLVWKNIF